MMKTTKIIGMTLALAASSQAAVLFETDFGSSAITGFTTADLDGTTTDGAGTWTEVMNNINTKNIVGNGTGAGFATGATDFAVLVDEGGAGGNSQFTSLTATLGGGPHSFTSGEAIEVQFDMAYSRSGANKILSMIGFGTGTQASTQVFRMDWNLGGTVALTASGAGETLDFGAYPGFASATAAYQPGVMQTFNITLDGSTLTYGAEGLASQSTTVLNSQVQLSSVRWAITGTGNGQNQGFWLDNVSVETVPEPSSAALLGLGGFALILRRRK